jgi:hypothetical protein
MPVSGVRRGLEPSRLRASYVDGECHYFALALHRATGCPLMELGNADGLGGFVGGHFVVALPDGEVADASGRHSRATLLAEWQARELRPISAEVLLSDLSADDDGEPEARIPEHVLDRLGAAERAILADPGFMEALGVSWNTCHPAEWRAGSPPGFVR